MATTTFTTTTTVTITRECQVTGGVRRLLDLLAAHGYTLEVHEPYRNAVEISFDRPGAADGQHLGAITVGRSSGRLLRANVATIVRKDAEQGYAIVDNVLHDFASARAAIDAAIMPHTNEKVTIFTRAYETAKGRSPAGRGTWEFRKLGVAARGDEPIIFNGTYSAAVRSLPDGSYKLIP